MPSYDAQIHKRQPTTTGIETIVEISNPVAYRQKRPMRNMRQYQPRHPDAQPGKRPNNRVFDAFSQEFCLRRHKCEIVYQKLGNPLNCQR